MGTQQEKEYWRKVRQDQADQRRRIAAQYEYVPSWELYRAPDPGAEPEPLQKSKWPVISAICLIVSLVYSAGIWLRWW